MQKRYIVIFSLIVISALLIAGCQEAVGGSGSSSRPSFIKYQYTANDDSLGVGINIYSTGACKLSSGKSVYVGETVRIGDSVTSPSEHVFPLCFRVVGCMNAFADGRIYDAVVRSDKNIRYTPQTGQVGKALLMGYDQNVCNTNDENALNPYDIVIVSGQISTGF